MFNTHSHTKQQQKSLQNKRKQQQSQSWIHHYKKQIQPNLISRYNRRINGFAKKMQDEPVVLPQRKEGSPDQFLKRDFHRGFNINNIFRFKNSEDWKSIYTPMERAERDRIIKGVDKDANGNFLSLRSIYSQSQYTNSKVEFRSREKQKQINPPMKYTNKTSEFVLSSLPKLNKKCNTEPLEHLIQMQASDPSRTELLKQKPVRPKRRNSVFFDEQGLPQNISEIDFGSLHNSAFRRNPQQQHKTQKQIEQQQQMKALAQNRLYFKSLIDLQQSVMTAKERNNLKQILVKCGVFKPVTGKVYQQEQIDRFLEMMKTRQ